jgi:shikimate dehydrogenase
MRTYGLLGKSLGHSFSQTYFMSKFQRQVIAKDVAQDVSQDVKQDSAKDASQDVAQDVSQDASQDSAKDSAKDVSQDASQGERYINIELDSIENIRDTSVMQGLAGFNVTIPYKQGIIKYLDELTPAAKAIGAVNCVSMENNRWIGHNTDYIGFKRTLLPLIENRVETALILGTGGASLAVAYVLKELGIRYFFVSRNPQNDQTCSYEQVTPLLLEKCKLIVNTTPVGQFPHNEEKPDLDYSCITNQHVLYDLIYNPERTAFLQEGISRGARYCNGQSMLEIQAEESYKIWNLLSE